MQKYIDDREDDPRYKHVGGGIALRIDARILADAQLTHTDTADESYGGEP